MPTGYQKSQQQNSNLLKAWLLCGQPKIVLKVESLSEIEEIYKRALELGIVAEIVRDAGKTQVCSYFHILGSTAKFSQKCLQVAAATVTAVGLGPHNEALDILVKPLKLL